ncbi:MAG: HAMP domain-containing histidine kinase [Planctomycetes bacterium]|nr:HAMP domain-containing histidine kinase [Planctomycetota bacterium]
MPKKTRTKGKKPPGMLEEARKALTRHVKVHPGRMLIKTLPGGKARARELKAAAAAAGWEEGGETRNHLAVIVGKGVKAEQAAAAAGGTDAYGTVVWGSAEDETGLCHVRLKQTHPLDTVLRAMEAVKCEAGLVQSLAEEKERTREALKHLEHLLATRDEFFSIATHDLRSPLTTMKLSLAMIRVDDAVENREILDIMRRNVARMEALVNDMLEVFRLYRGTFALNIAPTLVNQIVEDNVVSLFPNAIEKDITMDFLLDEEVLPINADPFRINQVVSNIVTNALKYTPKGGLVNVQTAWRGDGVLLTVADTGPGIVPDEQEKIFESFGKGSAETTGGEQSTGLGLYICRRIMEMHGGRIWVESKPGKGSTFHAFFPKDGKTSEGNG